MARKIVINDSEKIICKYFDNGYCRHEEKCRFFHPRINCEFSQCVNPSCQNRHPKYCRYFKRNKCKFGENCHFKHGRHVENKLKDLENAIEKMTKEMEIKDFDLKGKEKTIEEKNERIKVLENEVKTNKSVINKQKLEIKKQDDKIVNIEHELSVKETVDKTTQCKDCIESFATNMELREHIESEHNDTVFTLRIIARRLIEVKEKHKQICEFSSYCQHNQDCGVDCYYVNKEFIEDEYTDEESSDEDIESCDDVQENDTSNECNLCSFTARKKAGLKMHMKVEHKVTCKQCNYKTTTKALLKIHANQMHK